MHKCMHQPALCGTARICSYMYYCYLQTSLADMWHEFVQLTAPTRLIKITTSCVRLFFFCFRCVLSNCYQYSFFEGVWRPKIIRIFENGYRRSSRVSHAYHDPAILICLLINLHRSVLIGFIGSMFLYKGGWRCVFVITGLGSLLSVCSVYLFASRSSSHGQATKLADNRYKLKNIPWKAMFMEPAVLYVYN